LKFTHYYGKHRAKNRECPQKNVSTKEKVLKVRISSGLKNKIKEIGDEKNKSISELTRLLWLDYLKKKEQKEWREEIENDWDNLT